MPRRISSFPKTDDPGFLISTAEAKDVAELAALVNSAYRGDSSRRGWTTEADLLEGQRTDPQTLGRNLERPGYTMLCLRESGGGPILGCVALERIAKDDGPPDYTLGMLTVRPDLQAQGL